MQIDLNTIDDDLDSYWWQYIRASSDFAFINNVKNTKDFEVANDDILIHKDTEEDEESNRRFVVKRYHQILDGEAFLVDSKDAREMMELNLEAYINTNQKLPYGMEIDQVFKNKKIKIRFILNEYDSYVIKIDSKNLEFLKEKGDLTDYEIEEVMKKLPKIETNPLQDDLDFSIRKMNSNPVLETISAESGGKVFIKEAEIINIDKRKSVFQEHETIYYLLRIKNGKASSIGKKDSIWRDFDECNVKSSENAMEKYNLQEGDKITFNGKLKKDRNHGIIIQNIRKFEKS